MFAQEPPVQSTKEFSIRHDRAFLADREVHLWGLRCGIALYSTGVTERHVRAMDNMVAHGINLIGVYIQGSNGGWPDEDAGLNGFTRDGRLRPEVATRLEWLIREADKRGMVVMVGVCSPRKDQQFDDEAALHRALVATGQFLTERRLRNVFGVALHKYEATHGRLPSARTGSPHLWSAAAQILPFIEGSSLYATINFSRGSLDTANAAAVSATIPLYLCPSDPGPRRLHPGFGPNNYCANAGTGLQNGGSFRSEDGPQSIDGVFFDRSACRTAGEALGTALQ